MSNDPKELRKFKRYFCAVSGKPIVYSAWNRAADDLTHFAILWRNRTVRDLQSPYLPKHTEGEIDAGRAKIVLTKYLKNEKFDDIERNEISKFDEADYTYGTLMAISRHQGKLTSEQIYSMVFTVKAETDRLLEQIVIAMGFPERDADTVRRFFDLHVMHRRTLPRNIVIEDSKVADKLLSEMSDEARSAMPKSYDARYKRATEYLNNFLRVEYEFSEQILKSEHSNEIADPGLGMRP